VDLIHHTVEANGLKQHYVEAGKGPAVVLLHGFPETWYAWRKQVPALARSYRLIVPDLRGYGATEKPASGYDKRTMANDIRALMDKLGIARAPIIGHDRGARVATRFAKDHPEATDRLAVLDNIPTRVIFERMDARIARGHWFFLFNAVRDLPEALIAGREEIWLRFILQGWTYNPELLTPDDIAVYARAYRQHGALRGALEDYRAAEVDVAQDREDQHAKIGCPTLVLWGTEFESGGKMWDFEAIWREMARDVRFAPIEQCGHLPHEEQPDQVNQKLLEFLDGWNG
jgi:pimeloyl-ACP methyl ester carboxylesterase